MEEVFAGACDAIASCCLRMVACVVLVDLLLLLPLVDSPRFRYYACYFSYVMTASFLSMLYIPVFILRFQYPTNLRLAWAPTVALARVLGIRWESRGSHFLTEDQAAVVTINHQSMLDPMGLITIIHSLNKAWAVGRKEVFYVWPFGFVLWLAGIVFIDRNNGKEANIKLQKTMEGVKKHKVKLIMFPEGTRNRKGETLLPFKMGAFRMAIKAQIPIIPIVFSPYYFINSKKRIFYKGKIIISTLPPISTEGKTIEDLDILVEKTRVVMEEEYQKLRKEIEVLHAQLNI